MMEVGLPAVTLLGDATTLAMANGCRDTVVVFATPFSVAVIVAVRAVGTSIALTLNDADDPVALTLGGHVRPSPTHVIVAV